MQKDSHYYPQLEISPIKDPNRIFAFPFFGGLLKLILLIPVFIELYFVVLTSSFLSTVNAFVLLANGTYWRPAYDFNHKAIILSAKLQLFMFGLTNTYPGFDFTIHDNWKLTIPPLPEHPERGYAIPVFGFLARGFLLIPYFIFLSVIGHAAVIASIIASIPVCFSGKYPESLFEFVEDNTRASLAVTVYLFGLTDTYPSFFISLKHMQIKIALLIAGSIVIFFHFLPLASVPSASTQPPRMYFQSHRMHVYPQNQLYYNTPGYQIMPSAIPSPRAY